MSINPYTAPRSQSHSRAYKAFNLFIIGVFVVVLTGLGAFIYRQFYSDSFDREPYQGADAEIPGEVRRQMEIYEKAVRGMREDKKYPLRPEDIKD